MFSVEQLKELGQNLPVEESVLTELWSQFAAIGSDQFQLRFELVRLLRNTATKASSQMVLLSQPEAFLTTFCKVVAISVEFDDLESVSTYQRFLWQFLYNVSVGQESFQTLLWKCRAFKDVYFETLQQSDESKLKNVLYGIAFLRLKRADPMDIFNSNSEEQNIFFVESMLSGIEQDSDFALFCVQELAGLKSCDFLSKSYSKLNQKSKSIFLDVIVEMGKSVSSEIIVECSKIFKEKARRVLTTTTGSIPDPSSLVLEDAVETRKLLNCLGILAAIETEEHQVLLQQDRSLLIDAVYLLRMLHQLGKSDIPNPWTPARKLSDMFRDEADGDPVFGFKRDLIQLIGNLCHNNKQNQDLVREIEGVHLLLDCSAADGKNPFITQWVVLAIRNLCHGNSENQDILKSMDGKGKVDRKLLAEVGIDFQ